jgi:hypothetical protein
LRVLLVLLHLSGLGGGGRTRTGRAGSTGSGSGLAVHLTLAKRVVLLERRRRGLAIC